jgi:hypothetical protein
MVLGAQPPSGHEVRLPYYQVRQVLAAMDKQEGEP